MEDLLPTPQVFVRTLNHVVVVALPTTSRRHCSSRPHPWAIIFGGHVSLLLPLPLRLYDTTSNDNHHRHCYFIIRDKRCWDRPTRQLTLSCNSPPCVLDFSSRDTSIMMPYPLLEYMYGLSNDIFDNGQNKHGPDS